MSRDFANKAPVNKGSGASPKPQEEEDVTARKELPAWSWLIFGVVLGFSLARWLDDDRPSPKIPPAPVAQQAAPTPAQVTTPEQDAERQRYDFYNLLPQQEVTMDPVEEYKSTPRDSENLPDYELQIGSFKSKLDAERFVVKVQEMGFKPRISASSNGRYRVRIGPFKDRRKLNKAQDKMARSRIQTLLIRLPQ